MEKVPRDTDDVDVIEASGKSYTITMPKVNSHHLKPNRSGSISKLAAALAKAQGQMENADKDTKGNYGKYASLASTWEAIRKPFAENEIAVYQRIMTLNGKPTMCTMLIHSSGEFIDDCELELKFDSNGRMNAMQAMGSAVTYARRYSLQAVSGIAPADDDDGGGAGDPPKVNPPPLRNKPAAQKPPQNNLPPPPEFDPNDEMPTEFEQTPMSPLDILYASVDEKGLTPERVKDIIKKVTGSVISSRELTPDQLDMVIQFVNAVQS